MSSSMIIPPFQSVSLSTNNFRWLHSSAWTDLDISFFSEHRCFRPEQLFRPLSNSSDSRKLPVFFSEKWTLSRFRNLDAPLCWAEYQFYSGKFLKSYLFYDFTVVENKEFVEETLSLLISSIFIIYKPDILYLMPPAPAGEAPIDLFKGWGERKEVFSSKGLDWISSQHDTIGKFDYLHLTPTLWWTTEHGIRDKKTLAYLSLRHNYREQKIRPTPRKKGLFTRLFKKS